VLSSASRISALSNSGSGVVEAPSATASAPDSASGQARSKARSSVRLIGLLIERQNPTAVGNTSSSRVPNGIMAIRQSSSKAASRRISAARVTGFFPGMTQSINTARKGSPASCAWRSKSGTAAGSAVPDGRSECDASSRIRASRTAGLSSTTRIRAPRHSGAARRTESSAAARASGIAKLNSDPTSTSLENRIVPPIRSTSPFVIGSPRPEPPCRRLTDESA